MNKFSQDSVEYVDIEARMQERARCLNAIDVSRADVLLAAGEMTQQEWLAVKSVIGWLRSRIINLPINKS